jgi:outer membrane protein assembly factor BamB
MVQQARKAARERKELLALGIAMVIFVGIGSALILGGQHPIPTPIASRTVGRTTLPLHERWRRGNLILPPSDETVVASEEYACFAFYDDNIWRREYWLQAVNARSGEMLWETGGFSFVMSLATDGKRLFAAVHWDILAYDLADGRLLWRSQEQLPGHTGYWLQPLGEEILVYSAEDVSINRREQVLRYYNAQNGTLEKMIRVEVPPNVSLTLRSSSTDYWTDGRRFWAEDRASGQVRWQVEYEGWIEYWPVLSGSSVIYASGLYPRLDAVDTRTGILQWTYPGPLVSNFVLSDDTLYAIRQDGALVGIDPRTGREKGYVQFSPARTEEGSRSTIYWIAASDGWVFAYFGDSQELIALGP